ncbi:recombinase family protein [Draconibacterium sp. IB214405]|uniref:recombinase family protein n=1 Tax=Draconibacterium sp. IB214405 TaxID=3097352 RepID=UPI002A118F63|nr:recombinase family protein [Draconibacterium sp. IB214405]MDX8341206.1 recombinase family protein [Draconibacterium sp. IB214405]
MKVFYSRVSTTDQNISRQMDNLNGFDYVFTDYCSGSIDIWERPKGSQIKKLMDNNQLTSLTVHSIDRLGRNTLSVLNVWKELTDKGIKIVCRNPNFQNINDEGKTDMFSELMISILSTMSDFERKMILERQREGIEKGKLEGKYRGRMVNTKESIEKFLSKPKSKMIIKDLENGYTHKEISFRCRCSFSTIDKVKRNYKPQHVEG